MKVFLAKIKVRYYKFKLNLLGHFYNTQMIVEDLIDRLSGRPRSISLDSPLEVMQQQRQNAKLRRGIEKLVKRIYDPNTGKLDPLVTTQDFDLVEIVPEADLSLYEKMEQAQIAARILENPTDISKTDNAMVQHVVKNAPIYALEKKKRELFKSRRTAIQQDDLQMVASLTKQIKNLSNDIDILKRNLRK